MRVGSTLLEIVPDARLGLASQVLRQLGRVSLLLFLGSLIERITTGCIITDSVYLSIKPRLRYTFLNRSLYSTSITIKVTPFDCILQLR